MEIVYAWAQRVHLTLKRTNAPSSVINAADQVLDQILAHGKDYDGSPRDYTRSGELFVRANVEWRDSWAAAVGSRLRRVAQEAMQSETNVDCYEPARPEFDLTRKSRPVVMSPYQPRWPEEFRRVGGRIREVVGAAALRIDHIGSTAVPGLGAKDIIDVQVTVADLDLVDTVPTPLRAAGFRQGDEFLYDEFPAVAMGDLDLRKLFMREPEGERRTHIHIRELGRFNQRYALLFRDYLRTSVAVRLTYEVVKRQAAELFPDSIDGYLRLKDPVFHIIYEAATLWATTVGWTPDHDFV